MAMISKSSNVQVCLVPHRHVSHVGTLDKSEKISIQKIEPLCNPMHIPALYSHYGKYVSVNALIAHSVQTGSRTFAR